MPVVASYAAPVSGKPQPRGRLDRLPPQSFFMVSAVFHYLGPSLAVLLFARVDVLGVAWLRIASAAVVFAGWRRPRRLVSQVRMLSPAGRRTLLALGVVLAVMNSAFYLAVARLPLSTVSAIEFLGTVVLAAAGARTWRNAGALALTTAGVAAVTAIRLGGQPLGFVFAFANCALFMAYIVLGHRIANAGGGRLAGVDQLGAAMAVAAVVAAAWGAGRALPAFRHPVLLLAGAGVGVCSSVIPYVCDQLAMARLPRATFSLMLALLPVFATIIGAIVLRQFPTVQDAAGIALVVLGVGLHQEHPTERNQRGLRQARIGRTQGLPHLPRHDELRQPGRTSLASRRGRRRADRQGGRRRRRDVLRHRRHLLRRGDRADHRPRARQAVRAPGRLRARLQGLLPDGRGTQRPRAVPQAHPVGHRRVAAAARHRLRGPVPDPPLGLRHADRGDHGGAARRGPVRQSPLYRGQQHVRLAVRQGAARGRTPRLDPVRLHAEPLQPAVPGGGAGDDPAVRRPGHRGAALQPAGPRRAGRQPDQGRRPAHHPGR